jgi:hypothetical protein
VHALGKPQRSRDDIDGSLDELERVPSGSRTTASSPCLLCRGSFARGLGLSWVLHSNTHQLDSEYGGAKIAEGGVVGAG